MEDVVHWILTQDRLLDEDNGTVLAALDEHLVCDDEARDDEARLAYEAITAIWELDERTRGDTFATCQTIIDPWLDPGVAAAASGCDIDLDWLGHRQEHPVSVRAAARTGPPVRRVRRRHRRPVATGLRTLQSQQPTHPQHAARHGRSRQHTHPLAAIGGVDVRRHRHPAGHHLAIQSPDRCRLRILADSVLTNHGTKIIFSGISDPATMDYAAKLVGDEEVLQRSIARTRTADRAATSPTPPPTFRSCPVKPSGASHPAKRSSCTAPCTLLIS